MVLCVLPKFLVFSYSSSAALRSAIVQEQSIWSNLMASCPANGSLGGYCELALWKAASPCHVLSCTVECWFLGDLVFEGRKGKSKQSPGLGNRRSLFWVRSRKEKGRCHVGACK